MKARGTSRAALIDKRVSGEIAPPERTGQRGVRLRPEHQEEVRAKIQASHLVNLLQQHADGLIELETSRIKAIEILLSKSLSSLASTEVNMISNNDKMTEAEIMDKIRQLVQADPRIVSLIVPGEARVISAPIEPAAVSSEVVISCAMCGDVGISGGCPMCGGDPADEILA